MLTPNFYMKTFLQLVAHDLYQKYGADLSRTAIIFPNKRAGLFFNEALASESGRPLWSPAYLSISDLFRQLSPWQAGDPIRLVCELYKVFTQVTGSHETLDDFYFWGELLINDFDDLDKNIVDANRLFSNLQDLKDFSDDPSFLSTEQEEALHQFFLNFSLERHTELKERFRSLWDKLGDIYRIYRNVLQDQGIAYEGMLQRGALEQLNLATLPYDRYVFVGFNVLNVVEHTLFNKIYSEGRALFYWDYDTSYIRCSNQESGISFTHEAGEFIRRNLRDFPNELSDTYFHNLNGPAKDIRLISSPTENAQARFLPQWVRQVCPKDGMIGKESAVVLCNESLLLPVLHSIPEEVRNVNVTMGFPLVQTPVYALVNALLELQTTGYNSRTGRYAVAQVLTVLRHPYIRRTSSGAYELEQRLISDNRFYPLPSELGTDEMLQDIFTPQAGSMDLCRYLVRQLSAVTILYRSEENDAESEDIFNQLYRESLFRAYTITNRLLGLMKSESLASLRPDTLKRLLSRLLTTSTIPFHGEPAIGMQVMGVLETRNLDFRHLLLLSVNEGLLPKAGGEASFIPYNLRRAFGMTTPEHRNAVYAYYFYRLLQRAETITILYNTSTDGLNRGEMSRFALQFLVEYPNPIHRYYLEAGQTPRRVQPILVEKTPELLEHLYHIYDATGTQPRILSPSALNTYLNCRLMFYYRYVTGLKAPDEVSAEIDSALFGTIFHRSAELVYTDLTAHGSDIRREDLEGLLKDTPRVQAYVDRAFQEEFFHSGLDERPEYNGTQLIHARVIASYLRQLLRHDLAYAPFRMEGMERPVREIVELNTQLGTLHLILGGTIDRLDRKGNTLRIVDYKTGGIPKTPESIEQLFTPMPNRPGYVLQTFLYASIICHQQPDTHIAPALLYIHKAASDTYSPVIEMGAARMPKVPVTDFAPHDKKFRYQLDILLKEIFDQDVPFTQTEDEKRCAFCDFKRMCRR